jgi:Xaa-Pro aminopeptidase
MRPEIVAKQVKAMQAAGLDAMISCSPENFAYLTGFVVPSQPLIRHRHAMVIVTADGKTAIFGVDMEATTIKRREPDTPSRIWAEFTDSAMAVLASQLKDLGLASARIGIEMDYLPAGDLARAPTTPPAATHRHRAPDATPTSTHAKTRPRPFPSTRRRSACSGLAAASR